MVPEPEIHNTADGCRNHKIGDRHSNLFTWAESHHDHLGKKGSDAVITVPAYLNDSQLQATKDAGKLCWTGRDALHQRGLRGVDLPAAREQHKAARGAAGAPRIQPQRRAKGGSQGGQERV